MSTPAPAMVLFDIDGTLVRKAGPHHREALVAAVRDVTGMATSIDGIPVQGMLDGDILTEMMRREGARTDEIRAALPLVYRRAQTIYVETCPVLAKAVCPGVRSALARLDRAGVLLGLVTGNLTAIAWKKTGQAGLAKFFRFGAFSDMGHTRTHLVRLAHARARREGWIHRDTPVSFIGDHPNDIEAAKRNRVRSIAVATGMVSARDLAAHRPDVLLPTMRSLTLDMVL
jgi:phosphoglycolate phosphatase